MSDIAAGTSMISMIKFMEKINQQEQINIAREHGKKSEGIIRFEKLKDSVGEHDLKIREIEDICSIRVMKCGVSKGRKITDQASKLPITQGTMNTDGNKEQELRNSSGVDEDIHRN